MKAPNHALKVRFS